mgnify:CR=1 FL=1
MLSDFLFYRAVYTKCATLQRSVTPNRPHALRWSRYAFVLRAVNGGHVEFPKEVTTVDVFSGRYAIFDHMDRNIVT